MNIYTKNGDKGRTTLMHTKGVSKDDRRIHLLGQIDELTSHIGIIKSLETDALLYAFYEVIQRELMKIMAGIADATNTSYFVQQEEIAELEQRIDSMERSFPRKKEFVLPGGSFLTAQIDVARTIARRCERYFVGASQYYSTDVMAGKYLNRLSDYLYMLARYKDYKKDDIKEQVTLEVLKQINERLI